MGAQLKTSEVMETIGATIPNEDDDVVFNPMIRQAMDQQGIYQPMGGPGFPKDGDGDGVAGEGTELAPDEGVVIPDDSEQMAKETPEQSRRKKFGPILNRKSASPEANPTAKQREAGNYRMGHRRVHGLDVSIETAKGGKRRPEWPDMPCDYGYIKGTKARDGDHVDVFLGPYPESEVVYVIDQETQAGRFDEHKCMIGFRSERGAVSTYLKAYTSGWSVGPVTTMTIGQFKCWLSAGDTKHRLAPQVSRYRKMEFWDRIRYAAKHAPAGGVTIAGKEYAGGQFIPNEEWEKASPKEKQAFHDSEAHEYRSLRDLPEGTEIRTAHRGVFTHRGDGEYVHEDGQVLDHKGLTNVAGAHSIREQLKQINKSRANDHEDSRAEHRNETGQIDPKDDPANYPIQIQGMFDVLSRESIDRVPGVSGYARWAAKSVWDRGYQSPADMQQVMRIADMHGNHVAGKKAPTNEEFQLIVDKINAHIDENYPEKEDSQPAVDVETPEPVTPTKGSGFYASPIEQFDPFDRSLTQAMEKLPIGAVVGGFRKIQSSEQSGLGTSIWENDGGEIEMTGALNRHFDAETATDDVEKIQGESKAAGKPGRFASDSDLAAMDVAQQMGIPGSALNPTSANNFVRMAALQMGYEPKGSSPQEKAADAAAHLKQQMPHLKALIEAGEKLGHRSKNSSLVVKAKHAADGLIRTAVDAGWQPDAPLDEIHDAIVSGKDEGAKQYREQIAGALGHLGKRGRWPVPVTLQPTCRSGWW